MKDCFSLPVCGRGKSRPETRVSRQASAQSQAPAEDPANRSSGQPSPLGALSPHGNSVELGIPGRSFAGSRKLGSKLRSLSCPRRKREKILGPLGVGSAGAKRGLKTSCCPRQSKSPPLAILGSRSLLSQASAPPVPSAQDAFSRAVSCWPFRPQLGCGCPGAAIPHACEPQPPRLRPHGLYDLVTSSPLDKTPCSRQELGETRSAHSFTQPSSVEDPPCIRVDRTGQNLLREPM